MKSFRDGWGWLGGVLLVVLATGCGGGGTHPGIPSFQTPAVRRMVPAAGIEGVCLLEIKRKVAAVLDQDMTATGVLVDGRYLLTAGHNLFNAPYPWGRVASIGIVAGEGSVSLGQAEIRLTGGRVEVGAIPSDGIWTVSPDFQWRPKTWRDPLGSSTMIQHDYGFIDAGRVIGHSDFRLGLPEGEKLRVGETVRVAGYPGDGKKVHGATGRRLFRATGRVTAMSANLFSYDVITARGLSGAPVWVERNGRKYVVGIHVGSDFAGQKGAVARMVDRTVLRHWQNWRAARVR